MELQEKGFQSQGFPHPFVQIEVIGPPSGPPLVPDQTDCQRHS